MKATSFQENKFFFFLAGLALGIVATWLMTSPGQSTKNIMSDRSTVMDAHFIEQMIPHHEDAITMAELALTKSQREEIKTLSTNIISSQSREITQMKEWYQNWYGRALPTGEAVMQHHGMGSGSKMHMGMMGSDQDITTLETAQDFDLAFIEHMIPHHQMAVMMASMLKDGSQRSEMQKLAEDIIAAQTSEIEQMRTWYTEWTK